MIDETEIWDWDNRRKKSIIYFESDDRKCSLLLIHDTEIDIDALLEKDLLTLDEAMKTAHNAVLLAIKAISVLKSVCFIFFIIFLAVWFYKTVKESYDNRWIILQEMHRKLIDRLHDGMKEVSNLEVNKVSF